MITATLAQGLFALVFVFKVQSQGTDSCAETVTARSGDTCASIAELADISVTDFIQSNPFVTSCSELTGGSIYCISGIASSSPGFISTDGTCEGSVSCAGSEFGRCCSAYGFCGSSVDHCGEGCQPSLGECGGDGSTPEPPASSDLSMVVATSTKIISSTAIVQATVVITRTITDTLTARASTRIFTLTSVFPSTVILTSTTVVRATSSVRRSRSRSGSGRRTSSATLATPTVVVSTLRPRPTTTTTTTAQKPPPSAKPTPKPSPILPQTPETCGKYDKIGRRDDCRSIANRNDISLNELYKLNPSISARTSLLGSLLCKPGLLSDLLGGKCQVGCEKLWEGYYVCTSAR
ncbi:hypothetical protein B0T18DRAFT_318276 [Schizothecium vesticola]|uniref:Carbohydrate-binding module family 18 protein n=1 Tax=Schizothecium vesticola TaxID=314040 RepID=A0AA40KA59_9PEZI|nr:hypothetical protein B0T18DRAFT_318276 [Schizothecium vesticola]